MGKRLIRRILCGALLWILIFFEVSILMFGFKLQPGASYYSIHYILMAILTIIVAFIYFNKVIPSALEGFKASIIMLITGIILDCIITIPLFVHDWNFFFDKFLLFGYLENILLIIFMGYILKKSSLPAQKGKGRFLDTLR